MLRYLLLLASVWAGQNAYGLGPTPTPPPLGPDAARLSLLAKGIPDITQHVEERGRLTITVPTPTNKQGRWCGERNLTFGAPLVGPSPVAALTVGAPDCFESDVLFPSAVMARDVSKHGFTAAWCADTRLSVEPVTELFVDWIVSSPTLLSPGLPSGVAFVPPPNGDDTHVTIPVQFGMDFSVYGTFLPILSATVEAPDDVDRGVVFIANAISVTPTYAVFAIVQGKLT